MTHDDLNFYCTRLKCKMTEAACIDRQRKAYRMRRAVASGKVYDDALYGIALFCLTCQDGEALRRRLKVRLTEKPRPKIVEKRTQKHESVCERILKLVRRVAGTKKPHSLPPVRVPAPIEERPLCSECHRWAAVTRGLCRSCYGRQYRQQQKRSVAV